MKVDPQVARKKFAIEVDRICRQSALLRNWGCWIADTTFPSVKAVFIPRRPMRFTLPVLLQPAPPTPTIPPEAPTITFVTTELPILAGRAFGVVVGLDDFDQRAPSVTFCDPWSWEPLTYDKLFRANHVDEHGKVFNVLLNPHPLTHMPFLCLRGIREYHEHPQHTGDDWLLYRGQFGLFAVLHAVWRTCIEMAIPNLLVQPPNIQVRWEVEMKK